MSLLNNSLVQPSEILISSEDEDEIQTHHRHTSVNEIRSIRSLINQARMLLVKAEAESRPEPYRTEMTSIYKYSFSSNVKVNDLFRDHEMTELLNIMSLLKSRLSAEHVFALGCPQHPEERKIYDELVMHYSDQLLETLGNVSDSSLPPREGRESVFQSNLGLSNVNLELGPSTSWQSRHDCVLPKNSHTLKNCELLGNDNGLEVINHQKNIEELLQNVQKLTDLIHLDYKNLEEKWNDPEIQTVLNAIYSSLTAALKFKTENRTEGAQSLSPSQRKRKRSGDDVSKSESKKSKEGDTSISHEEEENCSVCLEPWTTGGEHRVTCLKCGHLFGMSCILKWVEQAHCCPQCKAPAKKSDLRNIFVTRITAEDTSERDRALKLLEEEKAARRQLEQKEAQARHRLELHIADNEALRTELIQLRSAFSAGPSTVIAPIQQACNPSSQSSQAVSSNKRYHQFMKINIAQDANCRVFEYSRELGMVVVSQKSTNALFRGYGIKMFSRDLKPLSYQPLHSGAIRDMCFRPASYDGQLLSCGLDKSIQLTSVTSKVVIQKYTVSSTVWCCAWNTGNTNLFYAGMEKGVVREFDIRMTNTHVQDIMDSGGCPISNIQYWNSTNNSTQGLLIAQLQNVTFKQHVNDQYTTHVLPAMQSPLVSLSLHNSGYFLSSYRPGAHLQKCRYEICSLTQNPEENTFSLNRQAVWDGGNMQVVISRNTLISHPESDNDLLAVTANHCSNLVSVWDVTKKQELQSLPCYDKAVDIKAISHNGGDWLGVLTEKDLVLYKWRE
ncbi:E3 ubiquitin-protein ligase RFWD3 [Biomphalaria pfeifferi]|uniref:RING-type E3 ubiquitin transferase n=1 Tax=Biomphalaria pfeifferi TaxID=112525 RepID=A0AAD8C8Z5_BIOPF|nr:E3 ubiquitin-protein ligase RFWD3 [Biomphalaria pfeifferi]